MRPLRLVLQAFGPYAGCETLDFSVLTPGALFLVHGATGSGKTSILDGICYALYGESSGLERGPREMRSHHAPADLLTEVSLDFALGSRRLRVQRIPEQERPKKSGSGTTTQKADATLYRLDDQGQEAEVLATGSSGVGQEIEKLLGFAGHQFRQVVVLPQGGFRQLLSADSKDREAILERLFATQHYARIAETLKRRAQALESDARTTRSQCTTLIEPLARSLELPLEPRPTPEQIDAGLRALRERLDVAKERAEQSDKDARRAEAEHTQAEQVQKRLDALTASRQKLEALEAHRTAFGAVRSALEAARRAEPVAVPAGLRDAARVARTRATERAAKARTKLPELAKDLEDATARKAREDAPEAQARREQASTDVARLEALAPKVERLDGARERQRKAAQKLQQAQEALQQATSEQDRLQGELEDLRARHARGVAHRLAQHLTDGAPCPVCGALDHPSPAPPDAASVSDAQLDAATVALREQERRRAEAERWARERQADAAKAQTMLEEMLADLGELAKGADSRASLDAALAKARGERDRLVADFKQAQEAASKAEKDHALAKQEAEGATQALKDADVELVKQEAELQQALDEAEFAGEAAWQAARLPRREAERKAQELRTYESDLAGATARHEVATREAAGLAPPDLEALRTARQQYSARARAHLEEVGTLRERLEGARTGQQRLRELEQQLEESERLYGVLGPLSTTASGANEQRISFVRFVLAALLDEVLAAASERLLRMSSTRYRLLRREEVKDHRSHSGLELDVDDAWTGEPRATTTLSGGEGFQASLALALGLADVVQRHAGGIRLDALFVDEGFGTLDPEALDHAIDTLLRLKEGGRMVGIISHVPELRERIDVRLEVTATPQGSHARFVQP